MPQKEKHYVAKLKAPLMSLGASGALGKALVFFGWKGLDVVREYVIPTNPQTTGQTTQRGYLTAAVAAIHAALGLAANPLAEDDISAYALLGSTRKTPRTWFNEVVKAWLDAKVLGRIPVIYRDGEVIDETVTSIDITIRISEETASQLAAGRYYFGTSKTSLVHSVAASVTPGVLVELVAQDLSAFLTAGIKYFFQFRPNVGDPCQGNNSGIYYFTAD